MLRNADGSKLKKICTCALLWTVNLCVIAGCALKDFDWPSREVPDSAFYTGLNAFRGINSILDYIATLFVVYHLYKIND